VLSVNSDSAIAPMDWRTRVTQFGGMTKRTNFLDSISMEYPSSARKLTFHSRRGNGAFYPVVYGDLRHQA
jgi:hypothetical protein